MMHLSRRGSLALVLGLAVSGMLFWLAWRQVDPPLFYQALAELTLGPLVLSACFIVIGIGLRSARWRLLGGDSGHTQISYTRATALGVFANFVLPARLGELARVVVLHRLLPTPLAHALASAFIDRLADVLVLITAAMVLYLALPVHELIGGWLTGFVLALGLFGLVVLGTSRRHALGRIVVQRLADQWRSQSHLPIQPLVFMGSLRAELSRCARRLVALRVVGLLPLVLVTDYLAVAYVLEAFELALPPSAPLVLWVFLAAGSALPSAPGYVGVYQLASLWALTLYAVPAAVAVALATVFQVVVLTISGLLAGLAAWGLWPSIFSTMRKTQA